MSFRTVIIAFYSRMKRDIQKEAMPTTKYSVSEKSDIQILVLNEIVH